MGSEERWARLAELVSAAGMEALTPCEQEQFVQYLELFLRWNARMNLSAIREEEGILKRHFLESIGCARLLPEGIATLLDFGSGGGFPGVPVAICRGDLQVTLAESQGKKAAFLQEVVRTLGLKAKVHAGRAEELGTRFDCVTMRAVDRMESAVREASGLVATGGWLALMTTEADLAKLQQAAGEEFEWSTAQALPGSEWGYLALAKKL